MAPMCRWMEPSTASVADIAADEWQANALVWKVLFRCIRIQEVENGCFKLLVCHFQHIQCVLLCLCHRTGRNGNVGFAVGSYRNSQLFVMRRAFMECDLHFVQFHAHSSVSTSRILHNK